MNKNGKILFCKEIINIKQIIFKLAVHHTLLYEEV